MKKRSVFAIGALSLFLALFLWARALVSWRPQRVAKLRGIHEISFSRDGKSLRAEPQTFEGKSWTPLFFEAQSKRQISDVSPDLPAKFGSPLSLKPHQNDAGVSVCDSDAGACFPLQNARRDDFFLSPNRWEFSPASDQLFLVTPHAFSVWSPKGKLKFQTRFRGPIAHAQDFKIAPDGQSFAVRIFSPNSAQMPEIPIFDAKSGQKRFDFPITFPELQSFHFSPDGRYFWIDENAFASHIEFFDVKNGRALWRHSSLFNLQPAFLPSANAVILATDEALQVRDIQTGKLQRELSGAFPNLRSLMVSPDGSQIWLLLKNGEIWRRRLR